MRIIPLAATPSQTLNVKLGSQYCRIDVYMKSTGLFMDLYVKGVAVTTAALCRDRIKIVRRKYLNFSGDLAFMDTQGASDPQVDGLGTRYVLTYIEPVV